MHPKVILEPTQLPYHCCAGCSDIAVTVVSVDDDWGGYASCGDMKHLEIVINKAIHFLDCDA